MKYTVKRSIPNNYIIYIAFVFIFVTFAILGASKVSKLTDNEITNLKEFTDEIFLSSRHTDFFYIIKNNLITNIKMTAFVLLCSISHITSYLTSFVILNKGFSMGFASGFVIYTYGTKGILYSLLTVVAECIVVLPMVFVMCALCIKNRKNNVFKISALAVLIALLHIIIGIFSSFIITKI